MNEPGGSSWGLPALGSPHLQAPLPVVDQQPISFLSVLGCIDADFCVQILILLHFSRSTRLAFLRTAPISKIQSKIVSNFAKLNIENSIGTSQFSQENCYFSPKLRWNFVGISRTCSKISKLSKDCRKFGKILRNFGENSGNDRKIQSKNSIFHFSP